MDKAKLIILLCCAYNSIASHSHTIPIEEYETKLHVLGQHVEIPETPVKVIKITKTIAVKVPVPYPVKVIEKVPYPVHVSKPYPVPVPQIVKVPYEVRVPAHSPHSHEHTAHEPHSYNVQENGHTDNHQFDGINDGHQHSFGAGAEGHSLEGHVDNSYEAPANNHYGYAGNSDTGSFESKSYDDAIKAYLDKQQAGSSDGGEGNHHYH